MLSSCLILLLPGMEFNNHFLCHCLEIVFSSYSTGFSVMIWGGEQNPKHLPCAIFCLCLPILLLPALFVWGMIMLFFCVCVEPDYRTPNNNTS